MFFCGALLKMKKPFQYVLRELLLGLHCLVRGPIIMTNLGTLQYLGVGSALKHLYSHENRGANEKGRWDNGCWAVNQ